VEAEMTEMIELKSWRTRGTMRDWKGRRSRTHKPNTSILPGFYTNGTGTRVEIRVIAGLSVVLELATIDGMVRDEGCTLFIPWNAEPSQWSVG
jgi:hypothetical protein